MFSDHLRKIDDAPAKTLLLVAAGVVIVCQLAAMVMVVDGQVEKAQMREASQASARAATVWCMQNSRGTDLRNCERVPLMPSAQTGIDLGNPTPQVMTANSRY